MILFNFFANFAGEDLLKQRPALPYGTDARNLLSAGSSGLQSEIEGHACGQSRKNKGVRFTYLAIISFLRLF